VNQPDEQADWVLIGRFPPKRKEKELIGTVWNVGLCLDQLDRTNVKGRHTIQGCNRCAISKQNGAISR